MPRVSRWIASAYRETHHEATAAEITIAAYNNANSQPFLGPDFFNRLSYDFSWRDVPYPEEKAAGGSIVGFRPL